MTSPEYRQFIEDLKTRVVSARISAARAVNRDLILLYWDIGRGIVEKQRLHNWGESVVEMVAADLRRAFPSSRSFSSDNVWRMRQFHLAYGAAQFLGQAVPETASAKSRGGRSAILGQAVPETSPSGIAIDRGATTTCLELLTTIPWGQNLLILKKLADPARRHRLPRRARGRVELPHRRLPGLLEVAQGPQGPHALQGRHRPPPEDPRCVQRDHPPDEGDRRGHRAARRLAGGVPDRRGAGRGAQDWIEKTNAIGIRQMQVLTSASAIKRLKE